MSGQELFAAGYEPRGGTRAGVYRFVKNGNPAAKSAEVFAAIDALESRGVVRKTGRVVDGDPVYELAPGGRDALTGEKLRTAGQEVAAKKKKLAFKARPPEESVRVETPESLVRPSEETGAPRVESRPGPEALAAPARSNSFAPENADASSDHHAAVHKAVGTIPETIQRLFHRFGGVVKVGRMQTEISPSLKGKQPAGYPEGATWDHVEGSFSFETKTVIVPEFYLDNNGNIVRNDRAESITRHEIGHEVDAALGVLGAWFSGSSKFRDAYKADVAKLTPEQQEVLEYYLQGGRHGPAEVFAELFAHRYGGGADAMDIRSVFPRTAEVIRTKLEGLERDGVPKQDARGGVRADAGGGAGRAGGRDAGGEASGGLLRLFGSRAAGSGERQTSPEESAPSLRPAEEVGRVAAGAAPPDAPFGADAEANRMYGMMLPIPPVILRGLERFGNWLLKTGAAKSLPAQTVDVTSILPRLEKNDDFKVIFSDPNGMGRVPVLARLFDPRGTERTPDGMALTAHSAARVIGDNIAALWGAANRQARALFRPDTGGQIDLAGGRKGHISDAVEAEMRGEESGLSPEQKAWVKNVWTPLLRDVQRMMRDEGVEQWIDGDDVLSSNAVAYFPRPAIGKKGLPASSGPGQPPGGAARPGSKAFFQKGRQFKTEKEGVESKEQMVYDPDVTSRVTKFIAGVYRAVADHRLATDPALQGRTYKNESEVNWLRERPVHGAGPAFRGKAYPMEIAAKLDRMFSESPGPVLANAAKVAKAMQGVMLGGDVSVPFIQGLVAFYARPQAWAKGVANGFKALWDSEAMGRYLNVPDVARDASDFVQLGGSVGRLRDFLAGLERGEFATTLPVVGKGYEVAGRFFGAFLDTAKLEMYRAWKDTTPQNQRVAMVESIENMLGHAKMAAVGLSPARQASEHLSFMASAYYRSAPNLIATMFQRGVPGRIARNGLARFAAGMALTAFAGMKAVGLSDDEIEERFNPSRGKFLKVPVGLGDGKTIEIGFGNIYTSLARLAGDSAEHLNSDQPIDTGVDGNPILHWLRGKAGVLPRLALDVWSGKDYFGNRVGAAESTIRAFEPIALQQLLHGEGGSFEKSATEPTQPGRANVADAVLSLIGFQSFPGSPYDTRLQYINRKALETTGKQYNDLSLVEQSRLLRRLRNDPGLPPKQPASALANERARAIAEGRMTRMEAKIDPRNKAVLDEFVKRLPTYQSNVSVHGTPVILGQEQAARYEDLLVEEYDRMISRWSADSLRQLGPAAREQYMGRSLELAKTRAKARLIHGDSATPNRQSEQRGFLSRLLSFSRR